MVIKNVWGAGGVGFGGDHDILKMTFFFWGGAQFVTRNIRGHFLGPKYHKNTILCGFLIIVRGVRISFKQIKGAGAKLFGD